MKPSNPSRSFLLVAAVAMVIASAPVQASESDDRLDAAFNQSYVNKTYLKDDSVKFVAKDGVVTLTGTVADDSHKVLAEETAANLPGVTKVDNQLSTKLEKAGTGSDTWIASKVKAALLFHSNVSAKTTVAVKGGVVTLTGVASSAAERDLTGEYAKDVDGVSEVKNEMTVATAEDPTVRTSAERIDDASIAAQVKTALRTHRSTSSFKTVVTVRNGEVDVTGIAANAAEKSLVSKLVGDIKGVNSVKNQMTIAEPVAK